jgi:hypothetical protein
MKVSSILLQHTAQQELHTLTFAATFSLKSFNAPVQTGVFGNYKRGYERANRCTWNGDLKQMWQKRIDEFLGRFSRHKRGKMVNRNHVKSRGNANRWVIKIGDLCNKSALQQHIVPIKDLRINRNRIERVCGVAAHIDDYGQLTRLKNTPMSERAVNELNSVPP